MVETIFRLAVIPHIPLILAFIPRNADWNNFSTVGSWPKTPRFRGKSNHV